MKNCAGYLEGKQKGTGSYLQGTCRVLEGNMGIPALKGKKQRPGCTGQGKSDNQEVLAPGCVRAVQEGSHLQKTHSLDYGGWRGDSQSCF